MPTTGNVKLPILKTTPPPPPPPFAPGSRVHLRTCMVGVPGVVLRMTRGRVEVKWPQFNFVGRYRPDRLALAAEPDKR
jgi:hypothetical protein